jgi:hypothetical protein
MSDLNTFYPEGKKISVAGEEFAIKPFVLKNRTKVLRIISETLLEVKKAMPDAKETDPGFIPAFINVAGERVIEIYEIALSRPREWIEENITLKNEVEILTAISEVNDLPFLFRQVAGLLKGMGKTI